MKQTESEHIINKTLASWDSIQPTEVSPFLWTRINAQLFSQEPIKIIAQPAMKVYLALWATLIIIHGSFWLTNTAAHSSTSEELRNTFFSDDNPYSSR